MIYFNTGIRCQSSSDAIFFVKLWSFRPSTPRLCMYVDRWFFNNKIFLNALCGLAKNLPDIGKQQANTVESYPMENKFYLKSQCPVHKPGKIYYPFYYIVYHNSIHSRISIDTVPTSMVWQQTVIKYYWEYPFLTHREYFTQTIKTNVQSLL